MTVSVDFLYLFVENVGARGLDELQLVNGRTLMAPTASSGFSGLVENVDAVAAESESLGLGRLAPGEAIYIPLGQVAKVEAPSGSEALIALGEFRVPKSFQFVDTADGESLSQDVRKPLQNSVLVQAGDANQTPVDTAG